MTNQKIPIMEPNADQRTAPESKPHGRDDLKSLPLTFLTHFWSPIPCIIEADCHPFGGKSALAELCHYPPSVSGQ